MSQITNYDDLEQLLRNQSYVNGCHVSQSDIEMFKRISSWPESSTYPNLSRWMHHVSHVCCLRLNSAGDLKASNGVHKPQVSLHQTASKSHVSQTQTKSKPTQSESKSRPLSHDNVVTKSNSVTNKWNCQTIRKAFIDYFVQQNHVFWPSSPVVPVNDPTLLFANAGMNQYKPLFLGTCDPSLEMAKLTRVVNSQKCIRAGGKHNDLDDVGKDVYHHTFFEMLGNWSFGDYFKEEAIFFAWDCLTTTYGLDKSRIYVTYFGGDKSEGLQEDIEARDIWLKYLPAERILPFGCKENFWEMGATGPCGPCSEIHYDRIGGRDASLFVNADRPDVIEIWNVVFIQFNREADGSLKELPSKHVDTGMGFERLSSILQGKDSNYDTDIFMPIFEAIHANCNCRPYEGLVGADDRELIDMAYRVVADHIRTLTFAITDGAVPSSEGRGYVLRRILRRAVRYGQEILHAPPGFFASLVSVVVDNFKDAFPELETRMKQVKHIIADEEHSFNRTLDQGVKHFGKVVAAMQTRNETVIPAQEAHLLFGSMGFPLDLTELMAAERGLTVDTEGFHALMENDRKISEAAEAARKSGGSKDLTLEAEQTSWLSSNNIAITDSSSKYEWNIAPKVHVVAIFHGRGGSGSGFETKASGSDGTIGLILDQTPFYYESGGQIFDTGRLHTKGCDFVVDSVQTYAGYVVHVGSIHGKDITVGKQLVAHVDYNRRSLIAPNHTMTHVLNFALRKTLLSDLKDDIDSSAGLVEQKGSLVDAEKLRFDFSWNGALTSAQVHEVETTVVKLINSKVNVFAEVVPLAIASKIRGLRQVFGERYPDPVRVISVGADVQRLIAEPDREEWQDVSIEFCGGTHLNNTSEAEDFVLVEESGIAKGIRRIVGLTKIGAREARNRANILLERLTELENMECGAELNNLSKAIKVEVDQALVSLVDKESMRCKQAAIFEKLKEWRKANLVTRTAAVLQASESLVKQAKSDHETVIITEMEFGADGKLAKKIQENFKRISPGLSSLIASYDDDGEKIGLFFAVSSSHQQKGLTAKSWCDHVLKMIGSGKGGGRDELANASVPASDTSINKIFDIAVSFYHSFK